MKPTEPPLISGKIDNVDFDKFKQWFPKPKKWVIERYLEDWMECVDICFIPWARGLTSEGSLVRQCTCKMPLPVDLPWAIRAIVGVPSQSDVTGVFCVASSDKEVVMVQHTMCSGMPYANTFKVQDITVFSQSGEGALEVSKWHELVWISHAPSVLRKFIASKSKELSKSNAPPFLNILEDEIRINGLSPDK